MRAAIHHIQTASGELSKLRSEVLALEQRILTAQRRSREATEALGFEEKRAVSGTPAAPVPPYRLSGFPLKTNPELCARVQQALSLETKKEAEIAVGAVIEVVEQTLLNNLEHRGIFPETGWVWKVQSAAFQAYDEEGWVLRGDHHDKGQKKSEIRAARNAPSLRNVG